MKNESAATITAELVKALRAKTGAGMMDCKKALVETQGDVEAAEDYLRKAGMLKVAKRAERTAAEGCVLISAEDSGKSAFMLEMNSETDFVARSSGFVGFCTTVADCGLSAKTVDVATTLALTQSQGETLDAELQALMTRIGENIQLRRVAYMESEGCVGHYCHGDRIGVLVALNIADPSLARDVAMQIAATQPIGITPDDIPAELIEKEREIFVAQAEKEDKPKDILAKMVEGKVQRYLKEVSLVKQPFVKDPNTTVGDLLKEHKAVVVNFVRFSVGEGIEKKRENLAEEVRAQLKGNE